MNSLKLTATILVALTIAGLTMAQVQFPVGPLDPGTNVPCSNPCPRPPPPEKPPQNPGPQECPSVNHPRWAACCAAKPYAPTCQD